MLPQIMPLPWFLIFTLLFLVFFSLFISFSFYFSSVFTQSSVNLKPYHFDLLW